jgi:signal transduction histidine kinase
MQQIASSARDVASDIHRLAYELHPAKLDQLGLETTLRSWCRDLGAQAGIHVDFVADGVPPELPAETALCVYRIAQEALQNVARHSGSHSARVRLWMEHFALRLKVSDDGCGFDAQRLSGGGLGLVSMRERVRSLRGTIDVRSRPGAGTTVEAAVPVSREAPR